MISVCHSPDGIQVGYTIEENLIGSPDLVWFNTKVKDIKNPIKMMGTRYNYLSLEQKPSQQAVIEVTFTMQRRGGNIQS